MVYINKIIYNKLTFGNNNKNGNNGWKKFVVGMAVAGMVSTVIGRFYIQKTKQKIKDENTKKKN